MPWIQLKLNATATTAETLGELLDASGAQAVTFMDAKDTPVFEPLPGETRLWGDTDVLALYDAEMDLAPIVELIRAQQLLPVDFAYKIEQIEDKDWEREWMDNFHPMRFGHRLWVCPSWREIPEPDAVNVLLDPGLAFGTGTHPTTALCMEWLDSQPLSGKTVIDFGCGSGILAIAALKLGAERAIGIDIDPQALQASRDNAQRNDVADRLALYLPEDQPADLQADVLIANILAGPLRELAPSIRSLVRSGGQLALSGILAPQAEALQQLYGQWFAMDPVAEREEWARLSGRKR